MPAPPHPRPSVRSTLAALCAPLLALGLSAGLAEAQTPPRLDMPPAPRIDLQPVPQVVIRPETRSGLLDRRAVDAFRPLNIGTYHLALAISPNRRWAIWGPSTNSASEAQQRALVACMEQSGSACSLFLHFQNSCGAFAVSSQRGAVWARTHSDRAEAERQAMAACQAGVSGGETCRSESRCASTTP